MKESFVPDVHLEQLLLKAEEEGCDSESILRQVNLSCKQVANLTEISSRQYGEIYRLIMRATQNEWFGMFSAGRVPLGAFRLMGITLLECNNLQQAIYRAGDFSDICRGMNSRYLVSREANVAKLTLSPARTVDQDEFHRQLSAASAETLLTSMMTWHRFS